MPGKGCQVGFCNSSMALTSVSPPPHARQGASKSAATGSNGPQFLASSARTRNSIDKFCCRPSHATTLYRAPPRRKTREAVNRRSRGPMAPRPLPTQQSHSKLNRQILATSFALQYITLRRCPCPLHGRVENSGSRGAPTSRNLLPARSPTEKCHPTPSHAAGP